MFEKKLSLLSTNKLQINDLYALFKSSNDLANASRGKLCPVSNKILDILIAKTDELSKRTHVARKSANSEQISNYAKLRKDRITEIKRNISTDCKSSIVATKTSAEAIKFFFTPYWEVLTEAKNTTSQMISEMLQKYYANEAIKKHAQVIRIDSLMNDLQNINTNFNNLYQNKNTTSKDLNVVPSSQLRVEAAAIYTSFCTAIEQEVSYTPNETSIVLFQQLDDLRKIYHSKLTKAKADDKTTDEKKTTPTK